MCLKRSYINGVRQKEERKGKRKEGRILRKRNEEGIAVNRKRRKQISVNEREGRMEGRRRTNLKCETGKQKKNTKYKRNEGRKT